MAALVGGCGGTDHPANSPPATGSATGRALNPIEDDTRRTPCQKLESYIGYAALWVDPKEGPAARQWDEIPGRVSEVESIARIYASQVRSPIGPLVVTLADRAAAVDAARDDPPAQRDAMLERYRQAAAAVKNACESG
jgi:hypothetical protein